MSNSAHVVDGEASESDSDVEIGKTCKSDESVNERLFVISGEAPESDEEPSITSKYLDQPDIPLHNALERSHVPAIIYNSLLHQKLWECNISLKAKADGLVRNTTDIAIEKLNRVDKVLLSVQESVRATNACMTVAKARLKQLEMELVKANCSAALPTLKIK